MPIFDFKNQMRGKSSEANVDQNNELLGLKNQATRLKIIRMRELTEKVGLCKSAIYQLVRDGGFPQPFAIAGSRARGWLESTIDEWIAAQSSARSGK